METLDRPHPPPRGIFDFRWLLIPLLSGVFAAGSTSAVIRQKEDAYSHEKDVLEVRAREDSATNAIDRTLLSVQFQIRDLQQAQADNQSAIRSIQQRTTDIACSLLPHRAYCR